jgi:large subunit ribosomal protein L30
MAAKLRLTLIKSPIGHTARTRGTLRALGLRRIGQTVEVSDTDQTRGMTRTVQFLLRTEEVAARERERARAESQESPAQAEAEAPAAEGSTRAATSRRTPRTKKEASS